MSRPHRCGAVEVVEHDEGLAMEQIQFRSGAELFAQSLLLAAAGALLLLGAGF